MRVQFIDQEYNGNL